MLTVIETSWIRNAHPRSRRYRKQPREGSYGDG